MMGKFKKYEKYKSTKVKWIGEIPNDWEAIRLGSVFNERRLKVSDKEFPPLSVTKNGVVPQLATAAKSNDSDNRKGVYKGDFVINSRSDRKGSSGLAKQDGSVSLINIVIKPIKIVPQFSEYFLKNKLFIEEFYRNGHGIVDDLWTTKYSDMKGIMIPLPSENEQKNIANFLDEKTKQIDNFIQTKEKTIALLQERKAAIINQAVTKGLDPNVPMKDSGIEWLGDIPEHWVVKKLKYISELIQTGPFGSQLHSEEYIKDGFPIINPSNIKNGKIEQNVNVTITEKKRLSLKRHVLKKGDIVFARRGEMGRCGIVKENIIGGICGTGSILLRIKSSTNSPEYINESLQLDYIKRTLELNSVGTTMDNLNTGIVSEISLLLPSKEEQDLILNTLRKTEKKINEIINLHNKEIILIKEYRASLISAAVTGKIDVRAYQKNVAKSQKALAKIDSHAK